MSLIRPRRRARDVAPASRRICWTEKVQAVETEIDDRVACRAFLDSEIVPRFGSNASRLPYTNGDAMHQNLASSRVRRRDVIVTRRTYGRETMVESDEFSRNGREHVCILIRTKLSRRQEKISDRLGRSKAVRKLN